MRSSFRVACAALACAWARAEPPPPLADFSFDEGVGQETERST